MKHLFITLAMGIALVGCKEKVITIKEFKENDTLRAEWLKKCADENGFYEGSCLNAEQAQKQITDKELAEKYKKLGGIE